ncbi:hypothetical protein pclt_cds_867 [Pandoravirus celtis]|uniref:Uncharacterized protein n=1 Tax=Pandoravirus celtis TaxID=2568002 RepID=A0A4D6EIA8_9VIRU|nr:hypothetical protein pclt_cds_867 [Pandoravirus celtis]
MLRGSSSSLGLIVALLVALVCLVHGAAASTRTATIFNKTSATLSLDYYATTFGSFVTLPPQQVGPYSAANFTLTGSVYQNYGFIEYDVYYDSPSFDGCFDLTYLWDVVIGVCDSGSANCSPTGRRPSPRKINMAGKTDQELDCYYQVTDHCGPWGDPVHIITTNC